MKNYITQSIEVKKSILGDEELLNNIKKIVERLTLAFSEGNKVLFAGNGGSASDCNHLVTELVSKFYKERKALDAMSLSSNNALITALANDFGYEKIFTRQIEAAGKKGDVLFAISTSGMSKNIIEALKTADKMGLYKIGITGNQKCDMDNLCDILIKIPSKDTPIIQESYMMLGHLICKLVEEQI